MANKKRKASLSQNMQATRTQMATRYTSGPIPDATQLEHYDKVLPGAADRILTMAEK